MNSIENQFDLIEIELDEYSAPVALPASPASPALPALLVPPDLPPLPPQQTDSHTVRELQEYIDHKLYKEPPPPRKYRYLYYPTFTILISLAELALLIWVLVEGGIVSFSENPNAGPSAQTLLDAGGKWTPYIIERGEGWRLITAMLLHAGIIHYFTNMLVQIPLCWALEFRYGTFVVGIVYIASGIAGNVLSAIFVPQYLTVGASGSIFGILGMTLVEMIKHYKIIANPFAMIITFIVIIVFSFAFGLLPYVDNYAHLGGFVIGVELALVLVPALRTGEPQDRRCAFVTIVVGAVLFLGTFIGLFLVLYLVEESVGVWCPG